MSAGRTCAPRSDGARRSSATPAYFTYDAVLNTRERPTLQRGLHALTLDDVTKLVADGAQLVDTRHQAEFAGAHVRGAVNIGLGGSYATWCGTVLDPARAVVLIADPGREIEAATRLGRIGFDTVAGSRAGCRRSGESPRCTLCAAWNVRRLRPRRRTASTSRA